MPTTCLVKEYQQIRLLHRANLSFPDREMIQSARSCDWTNIPYGAPRRRLDCATYLVLRCVLFTLSHIRLSVLCLLCSSSVPMANAQCYQFTSSAGSNLTVNFPNVGTPGIYDLGGGITEYLYVPAYSQTTAALTIGKTMKTGNVESEIVIESGQTGTLFYLLIVQTLVSGTFVAEIKLVAATSPMMPVNLLPNGLTQMLPPVTAWNQSTSFSGYFATVGGTIQTQEPSGSTVASISSCLTPPPPTPGPPTIIDPIPGLLAGPQISNVTDDLTDTNKGTSVQGIATDGVSQVLIRIPATYVGEQFTLSVEGSQCTDSDLSSSDCIDEYGLLFDPTSPPSNASALFGSGLPQNVDNVTAVQTPNGPMAVAAYRAPVDFVRPGEGDEDDSDDDLASRSVDITIASVQNGKQPDLEITLVRPPVVLVHGFNTDYHAWDAFAPLIAQQDIFTIYTVNYGQKLFTPIYGMGSSGRGGVAVTYQPTSMYNVTATNPALNISDIHQSALLSHLGFTVTTDSVANMILDSVTTFKSGDNPLLMPVAAVRADIVAHSMGGLVVRNWTTNQSNYLSASSYGQGVIHKMITLGTPHFGTPQAVLSTVPQSSCSRNLAAIFGGSLSFESATVAGRGASVPGAAGQLEGDGLGRYMSAALQAISASSIKIPIAPIAGDITGLVSNLSAVSSFANLVCGSSDPLASRFTSQGFETIFDPALATNPLTPINKTSKTYSDGSVPLTSALMTSDSSSAASCLAGANSASMCFQSYAHSVGIAQFFAGSVHYLQDGTQQIADAVADLLNTSVREKAFGGSK